MNAMSIAVENSRDELRFGSLFNAGRAFAFPCDAAGRVDWAGLTDPARRSCRLVCASVGREVSLPEVHLSSADRGR
jgi:hypothetical protein